MDTNIFEKPIKKKKKRKKIIIDKPKPTTKTATKPAPKPKRKRRSKEEIRSAAIERGINPDQKKLGELIRDYDRLKTKPKGEYVRGTKKKKIVINTPKPSVKKRRTKLQVLAAIKAAGIDTSLTLKQQKERLKFLDKTRAKKKKAAAVEEKRILDTIKYEFIYGGTDYYEIDELDFFISSGDGINVFNRKIQAVVDKKVLTFLIGDDILIEDDPGWWPLIDYLEVFKIKDKDSLKIYSDRRYIKAELKRVRRSKSAPSIIVVDMYNATVKMKTAKNKPGRMLDKFLETQTAPIKLVDFWRSDTGKKFQSISNATPISETEALTF